MFNLTYCVKLIKFILDKDILLLYIVNMIVIFLNKEHYKIETEDAPQLRLPLNVIKATRKKLTLLKAAPDERTLRNWKSLHYEKLKGERKNERSIKINDQWRMVFTLDNNTNPPTISVIDIEDYH